MATFMEDIMSHTQKREKTTGFLDDLGKARKIRNQVRAMKTSMLNEMDMIANPPTIPTAEA